MTPSLSARLFQVRSRLALVVGRFLASVDGNDFLTVLALVGIAVGVAGLDYGIGRGILVASLLLATMTPIGTAVRLLIRGR